MDTVTGSVDGLSTWAEDDLGTAQLGDDRLVKRVILTVALMAARPLVSIFQACTTQAQFDGARRLLDSDKVTPSPLCEAMRRAARRRARELGITVLLLIQDTTSFNFANHKATEDLGPLGGGDGTKGRGFLCHTCFGVTPDGVPMGILGQIRSVRDAESVGSRHQRRDRARSTKESARWQELEAQVDRSMPRSLHTITVCDREADIMSFLARHRSRNSDFIVRAAQNRRLATKGQKLFQTLRRQPVLDRQIIEVRQHPAHTVRYALLTLQYCQVTLAGIDYGPKEDRCGPITITVIRVAEANPPQDVKPIEWVLLTSLPIDSPEDAWQYVQYYTHRWLIERYHFTLKSGCKIEDCQVRTRSRLECALVLYSVVAWRLLWLTYLARTSPELPASTAFSPLETLATWALQHDDGTLPPSDLTIGEAVLMTAQRGGYKKQSSGAPPGVLTVLRGLTEVHVAKKAIGNLLSIVQFLLRELGVPDTTIQTMMYALMRGA